MMCKLMDDSITKRKQLLITDLILEEIEIVQSHNSSIFHRSPFVLVRKHLVILGEGILISKILLEKLHRLNSNLLDVRSQVEQLRIKGFDGIQLHRNVVFLADEGSVDQEFFIWPNNKAIEIAW